MMKQLTAKGTYTDGSSENLHAYWYSSNPSAATVTDETGSDRGGILTIKSTQVAIITAARGNYGDTSYVRGRAVVPLLNATQVATGFSHSCALHDNASVKCWGLNNYGQLGDSSNTNSLTPVTVSGLSNATDITAGGSHNCALINDGTVKCWGRNQ